MSAAHTPAPRSERLLQVEACAHRSRALVFALVLSAATAHLAASFADGAAHDLAWHRVANGGGTSLAGGYSLHATIGQHEAGVLEGGGYALVGGFWVGATDETGPLCPADLDGDGTVGGVDLALVLSGWGASGSADLNGDGVVNGQDLAVLLAAWGPCP